MNARMQPRGCSDQSVVAAKVSRQAPPGPASPVQDTRQTEAKCYFRHLDIRPIAGNSIDSVVRNPRRIEVLSFEGCPNVDLAMGRAREAARATGFAGEVVSIVVENDEQAVARKFGGSPSIQIDGVDVDQSSSSERGSAMCCRLYANEGGLEGAPSVERIVAALRGEERVGCLASGLAAVLASSFPAGSEELFVALVRLLAEGVPVSRARLANALEWAPQDVSRILAQLPSIEYEREEIVAAALSLLETAHVFEVDGRRLYTWCALDALFLPVLLGKTCRVASPCAATQTVVRLEVAPEGVRRIEPAGAVVSIVASGCAADLRRSFCDGVRFFASEAAARESLGSGGIFVTVEQAFGLGAAIARHLGWHRDAPVFACSLPPPELRQRRVDVIARVRRAVTRVTETSEGFVFGFDRSPELRAELEEFVRFEAGCCAFISMTLADTIDGIELRMAAPAGAKPFIRAEFIEVAGSSTSCGCT